MLLALRSRIRFEEVSIKTATKHTISGCSLLFIEFLLLECFFLRFFAPIFCFDLIVFLISIFLFDNHDVFIDPAVDIVDENLLNLAYNDQQIDIDDEINSVQSRKCCDGIFAGSDDDHRIRERERALSNYA